MTTVPLQIYRFGTSGYRNDTDEGFGEAVVRQITQAFSDYLIGEIERADKLKPILIGGDTREKTRRFIPLIASILRDNGLDVFQADSDVPSPVLAYAAKYFAGLNLGFDETLGAILMTASHNPWPYGGYNFLTPDAAVMPTPVSKRLEALQAAPEHRKLDRARFGASSSAEIRLFDPYALYKDHLKQGIRIDYAAIRESGLAVHYDALYATGRQYFPRLLNDEGVAVAAIHNTDALPAGYDGMPEPTGSNLGELSAQVRADAAHPLRAGFANDGDSDRFGVLDENGDYLNPNTVLSLALYHLLHNRKQRGVVVRSQATTHLLDALAAQHDLPVIQTPVGYKYIAEEFIEHEHKGGLGVLIGGESSGGLSILGHIPEKDGLLANLLVAELIATAKQPLTQILEKLQSTLSAHYHFREWGVKTTRGQDVVVHCQALYASDADAATLGGLRLDTVQSRNAVEALEKTYGTRDGAKLYFTDGSWLLVRASGTEPIVRIYVEAVGATRDEAVRQSDALIDDFSRLLGGSFDVSDAHIKEKH